MFQLLCSLSLFSVKLCLFVALLVALRGFVWIVNMIFIQPLSDPLRHLPGPEGSLLQSHLQQVLDPALSTNTHVEWRERFGKTFRFNGFGKHDLRLMSFDFRVISHVLNSPVYEKPWQTRSFMSRLIGRGIFSMEGDEHKKQRRIVHSAFTPRSIKNMTPVFFRKAEELQERWQNILKESIQTLPQELPSDKDIQAPKNHQDIIDVASWISRASFDVIGLTTFNYDFCSIQSESEPFYMAYRRMFNIADKGLNLRGILELYFPILTKIWMNDDIRTTNECLRVIKNAGSKIVAERKATVQDAIDSSDDEEDTDLLSLLIKFNLASDAQNRLNDQELLDQCSTFLLGGADTVSVALSWCLYFLALNPEVQSRLRKELNAAQPVYDGELSDSSTDSGFHDCTTCKPRPQLMAKRNYTCSCTRQPRWEAIENLRYLDIVVRETLRLCPPVHGTIRVAKEDDQIPISYPVTLSDGTTVGKNCVDYLNIRKGSYVHVPIEGWSLSEDVWGHDASLFNPDRWEKIPEWDHTKPGPNNLMVFGYGPHSCLGHKFSFAEMKIFIATLLPHFEFKPAENLTISKFNTILTRPFISGKWDEGTQMPIVIRQLK